MWRSRAVGSALLFVVRHGMPPVPMSPISTLPPAQRSKDQDEEDDPDDPVDGTKEAGHGRLQVRNRDQRTLDDDRNGGQAKDSGQMGSICNLHREL